MRKREKKGEGHQEIVGKTGERNMSCCIKILKLFKNNIRKNQVVSMGERTRVLGF